jgi:hypothetical protein
MKNEAIDVYESIDIKAQVRKILRGLGAPEPPLSLEEVRELLRLDRHYYSTSDEGAIREFVSKLTIAGKQIVSRPTLLLDVVRKAKLSALWIPDRRRILIDKDTPTLKHRWLEAHEVGHSIIPWHSSYLLGDDEHSIDPFCHDHLETEANFAAGQLLFMQDRFKNEAVDSPISLQSIRNLSKIFQNTLTSTLWRFVEEACQGLPAIGIVCSHPKSLPKDFDPQNPCRYCIESPEFKLRFSRTTEVELFRLVASYCRRAKGGPIGHAELSLLDNNGEAHLFYFESFFNGYDVLTLGVYKQPARHWVAVS